MCIKKLASSRSLINILILFCLLVTSFFPAQTIAAPPPPNETIITNPSEELTGQSESNFPPPVSGEFDEERAEAAILTALKKLMAALGPRYELNPVQISVVVDWALGSASWKSKEKLFDPPVTILARRMSDGSWFATAPDRSEEFLEMLSEAPASFITESQKNGLLLQTESMSAWNEEDRPIQLIDLVENLATPVPSVTSVDSVNGITITPTPSPSTQIIFPPIDRPSNNLPPIPTPHVQNISPSPTEPTFSKWVEYWDERDGYGLAYPSDWVIIPASTDALFSSATLMNYEGPDNNYSSKFLDGAFKIDFLVHHSTIPADIFQLITSFVRANREDDTPVSISWELYSTVPADQGVFDVRITNVNTHLQENHFLVKQLSANRILVINIYPFEFMSHPDVNQILASIVTDHSNLIQVPTTIPRPKVTVEDMSNQPLLLQPCDWGNEVGDSPILPLEMPFSPGTTWTVGGNGYYYGDGTHNNKNNDYYATDWNLGSGNQDCGQNVYPVSGGVAYKFEGWNGGYGNYVWVYHTGSQVRTRYAHLNSINIQDGETVDTNKVIGTVGTSGRSDYCHLHLSFQVKINDVYTSKLSQGNRPSPMETTTGTWQLCDGQSGTVREKTPGGSCSAPNLTSPADGYSSPGNTITFAWSHPNNCSGQNGFLVRVGTSPGGNDVKSDVFVPGLQGNISFDSQWFNRDLFWSVRANVNNGSWSGSRRFRIEPPAPSCNPGADQIALYLDGDYNGQCVVKGIGNYSNPSAIGLPNDQISSIKVGSNVKATLCKDDDYQGGCEVFLGNDSNLSDNSIGNDSVSSVKVESRTAIPLPPTLVSPSNGVEFIEGNGITLSWTATGDQYSGEIWGGPGGTLTFGPQNGTSKDIGSQWAGYTYYWHVKAHNGAGASAWSGTNSFTVKPGTPTNLNAQANSCSQISLQWNDNSGNEQGFELHRNDSYVILLGPNATSYIDTDRSGNTTYTYRILAYRGGIKSAFSNLVSVTTPACVTVPVPPTLYDPANGAIFEEGQSIVLSWYANANQYSGEIWGGPGGTLTFGPQSGTSNNIGSQWAGYVYSWHVKGQNSAGWSNWSNTWTFTVRPGSPETLHLNSPDCHQINVSWSDDSGNEEGYRVYRDGVQVVSLGPDTISYSDFGLNENTTYTYNVKAYRGTIESLSSPYVSIVTQSCAPSDTEPPIVEWISPVGDGSAYEVVNDLISLEVYASDNVGIDFVYYYRWDAVNEVLVEIGYVFTDPYSILLDCSTLNLGWNEIDVYSVDSSGNVSDHKYIWLYRHAPLPDLSPFVPGGFDDAVVLSSVPDTTVNGPLYAGQPTYIDWYFGNSGWAAAEGSYYVEIWIDDVLYINYPFDYLGEFQSTGFIDWSETIWEPGWHLVRMVIDPENSIAESNEDNNIWENYFYWESSVPYYEDMESGAMGWDASGLWHLVDDTSLYQNSSSGTTSWWYGQESTGDYDTGSLNTGDLTSPNLYIPFDEWGPYYLQFKYWHSTESSLPYWDQRWLQASIDNGDFFNVLQLNDDLMGMWHNGPLISLLGLEGHTVRMRFHFDTIDEVENAYRGWYIDDFSIAPYSPPICGDIYEPNDDISQATQLYYGADLTADICGNGDYDYYQFTAEENDAIVIDIDAAVTGSYLDSFITLLDGGNNVISANDDDNQTTDSKLGFTISSAGTYYIKVRDYWYPSYGGPEYFYNIKLYTDQMAPESVSFINPLSNSWLNPWSTEIEIEASDVTSGIKRVEFLWHSGDWENGEWIWLGSDSYAGDGWTFTVDTSWEVEQSGASFWVWAYDFVENFIGEGVWNLGIDRTPPETSMEIYPIYGDAPFRDFFVVWNGNDIISGVATYDVQVRDGLEGNWIDLFNTTEDNSTFFVGDDGHTYYFRSRAWDFAENLGEYLEENGQVFHTVQLCPVDPDTFEEDNTFSQAKNIVINASSQPHNFHAENDEDWVMFFLESEKEYTIFTEGLGPYSDTVISLFDQDGTTLLWTNDDYYYSSLESRIDWQPDMSGIYYAKVNHWDPYGYGCSTEYNIAVYEVVNNVAPVVADIPDQTIAEGASFATISLDNYVSDVDNPDSEMIWTFTGNTDLVVSIIDRVATIAAPEGWTGNETVTFRATDLDGLWDEDAAIFTVTAVNDPPVVTDIPDQTIAEGASFATITLDNYVSDVDDPDTALIWTYTGNTNLTVTITNRIATITKPNANWSGSETITFRATDPGGLWDEDAAIFTVTPDIVTYYLFMPLIIK